MSVAQLSARMSPCDRDRSEMVSRLPKTGRSVHSLSMEDIADWMPGRQGRPSMGHARAAGKTSPQADKKGGFLSRAIAVDSQTTNPRLYLRAQQTRQAIHDLIVSGRIGAARRAFDAFAASPDSSSTHPDEQVTLASLLYRPLAEDWIEWVGDANTAADLLLRIQPAYFSDRSSPGAYAFSKVAQRVGDELEHDLLGGRVYPADVPLQKRWQEADGWLPALRIQTSDDSPLLRIGEWVPDIGPESFMRRVPEGQLHALKAIEENPRLEVRLASDTEVSEIRSAAPSSVEASLHEHARQLRHELERRWNCLT